MTFERSPEGVANRALFLDVDLVAYHESEKEESLDAFFWKGVFSKFLPQKRIRFLPSGGKSNIIEIYKRYKTAKNNMSIFLLDRDADDLIDRMINADEVIYSYRYSYENDISNRHAACKVATSYLYHGKKHEVLEAIDGIIAERSIALSRLAKVDRLLRMNSGHSVSRANYRTFLQPYKYGDRPDVSQQEIIKFIKGVHRQRGHGEFRSVPRSDWTDTLIGHFVYTWFYRITVFLLYKQVREIRLKKEDVKMMFVTQFIQEGFGYDRKAMNYYKKKILRFK